MIHKAPGTSLWLPGSHYSDPEFSWRDPVGPTALVFLNSPELGPQYENDLFIGDIKNGTLYRFTLNALRTAFTFQGAGLADRVADNPSVSHLLHTLYLVHFRAFLHEIDNVQRKVFNRLIDLNVMLSGRGRSDSVVVFLQSSQ